MHHRKDAVCLLVLTSCRAASDCYKASVKHSQDQHWVSRAEMQLGLQISARKSHMHLGYIVLTDLQVKSGYRWKRHIYIENTWC